MNSKDLSGAALVWRPCPDRSVTEALSVVMLDERLVACANILVPVRSLSIWRGGRGEAEEFEVLFKTDAARLDRAVTRLAELYPCDCPAISGWHCDATTPAVLARLGGELR